MSEKKDCQAYINKNKCNALNQKRCNKCKFYKTKEEYDEAMQKAMKICEEKGIYKYDYYFKNYMKRKDEENERESIFESGTRSN